LAINAGEEDEVHMRILSTVEEFNINGKNPALNDLMEELSIVKTQLERCIADLSHKGYVKNVSDSWRGMYDKLGYKVTDKGKNAMERYTSRVKHFLALLMNVYHNGEKEDLYGIVMENKDFLWFGYYKGLITKVEIESIAKKLDFNIERLWWHNFDGLGGGAWPPPFGG
jgi:hypothetical protein